MKATRIIFLRHGETVGPQGVLYSQQDIPLSEKGLQQTRVLVEGLKNLAEIKAVYASDLSRARLGAEWLAEVKKVPMIITPKLRELNFGRWSGKHFKELMDLEEFRQRLQNPEHLAPPGGETLEELQSRALEIIDEICTKFGGEMVVVFTHGGLLRTVVAHALDIPLRKFFSLQQDFGAVNLIDYYKDATVVKLVNGPFDLNFETLLSR